MEKENKISAKYIIAPLVSVLAFILLLGGASYAYYTQTVGNIGDAANISNANLSVPRGCTFLSSATNCVITGNSGTTTAFTDAYISTAEMSQTYNGNSVAQSTCALNIGVQGAAGCKCTYTVAVAGTTTTNYVTGSLKAAITSTNTSHSKSETDIASIGTVVSANVLTVPSNGATVYENFAVTLKAYNVNGIQDNQQGISYVYYLRATPTCTVA